MSETQNQHANDTRTAEANATVGNDNILLKGAKTLESKTDSWIQSWNPYNPQRLENQELQPVMVEESKIRQKAARWFLISFAIFAAWAFFAPIDAGVTVPGQVVVSGYRKAVQHPTGGVIKDILIRDGDIVKEGDILIKVNPLNTEANLSTVELQYLNALVAEARLKAERIGRPITWPRELGKISDTESVREAKSIQEKLYQARRSEFQQTIEARRQQLISLKEEQASLDELAKEGFVPRATAAQAMRTRLETETALNTFQSNYFKQVETELSEIQKNRDALQLRFAAARFDRALTEIRAPTTGTIVGLKIHTIGGVISAGQMLAEVLPNDGKLIADIKVPATAIDKVRKGAIADMHFTAFNVATTPTVPGVIKMVGVDKVIPDKTKPGEPDFEYYQAQVETTPEGVAMLGSLNVQPGMPVDVVVKTGERSFVSYLVKPISDRMIRAFKE